MIIFALRAVFNMDVLKKPPKMTRFGDSKNHFLPATPRSGMDNLLSSCNFMMDVFCNLRCTRCHIDIVDGRISAPVERLIPLFTPFYTSQVVQDF